MQRTVTANGAGGGILSGFKEPVASDVNVYNDIVRASLVYDSLKRARPASRADLRNYIKVFLGIDVPDKSLCAGHSSPMEYLWHAYGTDLGAGSEAGSAPKPRANGDCIVWANRGGGKTEIAAIATLLDCVFKPGCSVRILGGSLEQSTRMYEYLRTFVGGGFYEFLSGEMLKERCRFGNGASAQVLAQSSRSVRGTHVNKLRCDELELFDEDVFAAAKFTTQSTNGITAAMELVSTMHRPYGLMSRVISEAIQNRIPVFKWCVWEVIEKCRDRNCSRCRLWSDCGGKAKRADGYLKIDDCLTQMLRSSRAGFESEMLCMRPSMENVVFADFDPAVHVAPIDYDANLPLYRAIDFGFVNPFVCLWIQVDGDGGVRVIDEYIRHRATIDVHAAEIERRTPCPIQKVAATFCDPAGAGKNDVTGTSAIKELRSTGAVIRYRKSRILDGIELIRRALKAGDGTSKLVISPRCVRLIEAMQCYHYPDSRSRTGQPSELPQKDGIYDHPIDALRYFYVNHNSPGKTGSRCY